MSGPGGIFWLTLQMDHCAARTYNDCTQWSVDVRPTSSLRPQTDRSLIDERETSCQQLRQQSGLVLFGFAVS